MVGGLSQSGSGQERARSEQRGGLRREIKRSPLLDIPVTEAIHFPGKGHSMLGTQTERWKKGLGVGGMGHFLVRGCTEEGKRWVSVSLCLSLSVMVMGLDQGTWPAPDLSPTTEGNSRKATRLGGEVCEWLAVLGCACPSTCVSHPKTQTSQPLRALCSPNT